MKIQVHRLLQWITLVSLVGIAIFSFFEKTSVPKDGKANISSHQVDFFSSSNLSPTPGGEAALCGSAAIQPASILPGTFWQNPIKDFQQLIAIQEQMQQGVNRAVLPFAPVITATKTDALFTDNGSPGATPGDVIEYTIVIMNSGMMEATGVSFTDMIDANTTLVPGSVDATPLARNDSYTSIGNVGINVTVGGSVLLNDIDPDGSGGITVTAYNPTSVSGGSVVMNTNGSFTYNPAAGFEGNDSFTYTIDDGEGNLTNATVSITVSNMIWFINSSSVAATEDGRLNTPFKSIANFQAVNDGMGNNPKVGDYIFLHTGSGNYSGPITLLDNQKLIGQGASASLVTITGFTIPPYSNPLPATGGTNPVITTTVAATDAITLGMNNLIRGLTVGNTTGYKIIGTNFGTVTIGDVTTPDVNLNGTGPALSLTTGVLAGRINQLTSSSGGNNVVLSGVSGTLNPVSGTITSTAAGAAFSVTGSNPSITYPGTISKTGSTGRVVNIDGTTGNTITFSSAVSGDNMSTGVNINNANGNVTFPSITLGTSGARLTTTAITIAGGTGTYNLGTIALFTNNATAFSATNADGTINTNAASTINTTNGPAIFIDGPVGLTTLGVTFTSVDVATSTTNGITVRDANGSFTINGTGTTEASGGTLQNISNRGIELSNVTNITLKNMKLNDANTADSGSNCDNSDNTGCNAAIHLNSVATIILNNVDIADAAEQGINGINVSNLSMTNCIVTNGGDASSALDVGEDNVRLVNLSGTCSVTGCTFSFPARKNFAVLNNSVNLNQITFSNCTFSDTQGRPFNFGDSGLEFILNGTSQTNIDVDNSTFTRHKTEGIQVLPSNTTITTIDIEGCSFDNDPSNVVDGRAIEFFPSNSATLKFDINNNPLIKGKGGPVITMNADLNAVVDGYIRNNPDIRGGGAGSPGSAILISAQNETSARIEVDNNTISNFAGADDAIFGEAVNGTGTLHLTITDNTITTIARYINVAAGNSLSSMNGASNTLCVNIARNTGSTTTSPTLFRVRSAAAPHTVQLQGPGVGADEFIRLADNWNSNLNSPVANSGNVSVGGTDPFVYNANCTLPNYTPSLVEDPVVQITTTPTDLEPVQAETSALSPTPETPSAPGLQEENTNPASTKPNKNTTEKLLAADVTVNGSGSDFNLLPGESTTITFRVMINSPLPLGTCQISNQGAVTADGGISLMTDDPNVGGASDPTVTPLATMTLGNLVYKDNNKNGVFDGGDAGIDGVTLNLYQDVNANGVLDGGDGASIANTTTAGGGLYSFTGLCSGNYIVQPDPAEFNPGGQLYDNGLMTALLSSPIGGATDPDDNVDDDDNGDPVMGFGIATQAITLDYAGMNVEVNNTLDLGFKVPTTVTIDNPTVMEGNVAGDNSVLTFTVTRSDNTEAFDLNIAITGGTATGGGVDYINPVATMVSFTAGGSLTATYTVEINEETLVEVDETVEVTLSGAPSGVVITDATGLGTIQNDDAAVLSITATTQAAEDATDGLFTISTTNQFDAPVTINFTVTGTATSGTDYTSIGTSIIFPANTSSVTIPVDVLADMIVEANETVIVTLTSFMPANPSITIAAGPNNQATVTITDNDQATITIMDVSMVEGNVGPSNFSFKVTLDKQVDAAVSVNYMTVDGTAMQPGDYTSTSNTLTFPANSAAGTMLFIDVPVIGDLVFESNETFTVKLDGLAANGRNVILSGGGMMLSGTGTILNDDIPPVIINEIDVANAGMDNMEFIELYDGGVGNTDLSGLVIVLYNGANDLSYGAADLDGYTTNANGYFIIGSSGVPGVDIIIPNNTLQNGADAVALYTANGTDFPNGTAVTTTNLVDAIVYDTNNADDAGLLMLLNAGQPQVNEAGNGSAPCHSLQRIPNGSGGTRNTNTYQALPPTPDAANGVPIVTISVAPMSAVENGGPNIVYTVTRTGNTSCSLDVPYMISGTATNGNDYANIASSVTIPAGMTSATITVDPSNDQIVELDETVIITLTDGAAYDLGMNSSAMGTILNDDNAVISVNSVSNPESTTPFQFTVSISRRVDVPVTVEFSTSDGTATTGDNDYNAVVSQLVTFPAGSNADQTVNVTVNNDMKVEADEVFNVIIANLMNSGRAVTLGTVAGTGTIQNDDAATLTIDDVSMLEGINGTQIYTFTVTLNAEVQGGVMVDYMTADNTATDADNDYEPTNGTLNFAGTVGETETIMVTVNGDCTEELDETFFVNLSNIVTTAAPGAVTFADNQGLGTILNDDATFVGGIIYVDVNAVGLNNGTDWTNAFTNLQDALRVACTCGMTPQIWVADGTYYPDQGVAQTNDNRTSTFQLCNGVAVYGGFAGGETMLSERDIFANIAILSGDLMQNDGANFANNADNAYRVVNGSGTDMTARIDGFTITAGNANVSSGSETNKGAGMFVKDGSPCISNCIFSGNSASQDGGGLWIQNSTSIISNCSFIGNRANFGGGIYRTNSFTITLINCVISGNSATNDGGGIFNISSGGSTTLINGTVSGNAAGRNGGGICNVGQLVTITNTIVWNNQDVSGTGTADASVFGNNITITYSLIQGQNPGGTNKDGTLPANDPQFITPVSPATAPTIAGDLRLQITSPVIDMGNDAAVPADSKDVDNDGDTAEPTPDRDLNNRIVGALVDLGAFEFPCAADAGEIAQADLTICEGDDPGTIYTATGAQTDVEYSYAFVLVDAMGNIVAYNTTGDFDLTVLTPGVYTVYGLSYATFNTPTDVSTYLAGKATLADIQNDDADNGGEFCLDLTENTATITINGVDGGTIAADQTICSGDNPAVFTSVTDGSGSGTITYRWASSTVGCNNNASFTLIPGATSATYDPPAGLTQTTYYRRITISTLNGVVCRAVSNCLTVTVNQINPGEIAGTQTVCSTKDPAPFTSVMAATGSGMITYQWESSTVNCDFGFAPIDGATADTFDPAPGQFPGTTYFRRRAISTLNGVACDAISNCVILTVLNVDCGQFPWNGNN